VILTANFKPAVKINNNESFYLSSEIGKIEIQYSTPPDTGIGTDSIYTKIDDSIIFNTPEMALLLQNAIDNSFSKTTVKSMNQVVGVFKSGTCGGFPVLNIYLDEEDPPNAWTSVHGWVGASGVNSGANADLYFCVISGYFFETFHQDYAVLMLDAWNPSNGGYNKIKRIMYAEHNNNQNKTFLNGNQISSYGDCSFGSPVTTLYFYYFPGSNSFYSDLPNLSFEYAVLGRFGKFQGNIFFDDEDQNSHNNNELTRIMYDANTGDHGPETSLNVIPNIIDGGDNTRFYISKAPDECYFPNY